MKGRSLAGLKVETYSTSHLSSALFLTSIFIYVINVRSQKRVSRNQPSVHIH